MKKVIFACAALALLSSCNLAPSYSPPRTPTPSGYKEGGESGVGWDEARPSDGARRTKWWEVYGDPALSNLEDQVQVSNQTLKADEAAYRAARALVTEARAAYFPAVTTSPAYTAFRSSDTVRSSTIAGGTSTSGGSTTTSNTTGSTSTTGGSGQLYTLPVTATYEPDLWGRIRNTVAVNADNAQASAGDLANARLTLQADLAQDYFQIRALDEEKRILDATVTAYRQDLNVVLELFRSGIDSDEDVAQAQSQLDTAVAQATDLATARAQYEHAVAVLVGQMPSGFSLAPGKFPAVPPGVPLLMPSALLQRRPDIATAERQVAAANAQIGIARAAYFPALDLSATAGFESSHLSQWLTWPSRFWSLGPELSETLLDFGARKGQNQQAWAQYDQAVANYRETVLTAFQGVEDNLANLRILATEVAQRQTATDSTRRYLNLALARFKAGIDSYLNVTTAQTALLTNEENLVQTQLRQITASVALVQAMGGGWSTADLPSP